MNKFKKGDKVDIRDGSYTFGIKNGEYISHCSGFDGSRNNLMVVEIGLSVLKLNDYKWNEQNGFSGISVVNDLLVTDNNGSFWFTQSRFCDPTEPNHTIVIDDKTVILSHKSFLALREQLV